MSAISFSIIIPHKNIPDLLQRCLDSIPIREDIQVIVVDDNSSPDVVDFEHFPMWEGTHYEYYLTKEGKGAGYARNIGLSKAKGEWVLFADADDFFSSDLGQILNQAEQSKSDLIFFDHKSVLSEDISVQTIRSNELSLFIKAYLNGNQDESNLRFNYNIPVGKIIKRDIISRHDIRFSETRWSNDIFFSAQVGCWAKQIEVSGVVGYVMTVREGSLVSDFCGTREEFLVRLSEALKTERSIRKRGFQQNIKESYNLLKYVWDTKSERWYVKTGLSYLYHFHFRVFLTMAWFIVKRIVKSR